MMNLFRRYQKVFLGIIMFFIIISFVFFGTYDAILGNRGTQIPDFVIGKAIDGSPVKNHKIQNLVAMLDTDAQDVMIIEERARLNLLNDGVIRYDILSSEIGKELYNAYAVFFKDELAAKLVRYRTYKPYVHLSGAMGLESLWKQFYPKLAEDFERFQGVGGELSKESFEMLADLYVDQANVPPRVARQFFQYNQQQYSMQQDPYLANGDLSLFYAKSASDWFGVRFVEMVAQFIHNVAIYAGRQGYSVTSREAKASLMQIGMENLRRIERDRSISGEEFSKFFQNQLASLGLQEKEAVEAWREVLLFRKLVADVENSLMVDAPFYKEMQKEAANGVHVELYRLPKAYRGLSSEDLYKLETYLKNVDGTVEEVAKRSPELVVKKFKVKVQHLEKKDVPSEIGLKRTWAWEMEDRNWDLLSDSFPEVAKCKARDSEARFAHLNGLTPNKRSEIDHFARLRIIDETPEFIHEKLEGVSPELMVLKLTQGGEILPGINNLDKFTQLLEKEVSFIYTENRENYYRFEVVERQGLEVLSFQEAKAHLEKGKVSAVTRLHAMVLDAKAGIKNCVVKEELRLTGSEPHELFDKNVFEQEEGYVSEVLQGEEGEGSYFYRVGKHFVDQEAIASRMQEARHKLGREASSLLMKRLMGEITIHGPPATSGN